MKIARNLNHKKRRTQISALVLLACSSASMAANVVRGPYVQMGTDSSMIVRWDTDSATSSQVKFGSAVNSLSQTITDSAATTQHEVTLTGLSSLTRYYYSIGSEGTVLAGNDADTFFRTSPVPGQASPTRIWVIGDPGTAGDRPDTQDQQYVLDGFKTFNDGKYTDFWLMLGDNAYVDGTIQEYQNAVFNQYPDLLKQSPLWPSMGNHDNRSADVDTQTGGFYDLFSLPTQGEAGGEPSGHEAYYSFDYGNVHVVVLNSADTEHNDLSGPMDEWLEKDLSNTQAEWIITTFHHAPYGTGHDSDTERDLIRMRENFLPILEKHGVDLVMAGHNHYYSRTSFISDHYGNSSTYSNSAHSLDTGDGRVDGDGAYTKTAGAASSGTVYITHGAGYGGGTSSARKVTQSDIDSGDNHPSDYMYGGRGSMVLEIEGNEMKVNVINQAGEVNDYFTISHNGSTPPPPPPPPER
ncbi:MAG: metallophosphoesterase family protein, partial [Algicola sp.]|nr:metallophosphoesterase family protein [Algicola sp.]